jgi:peptidoglycan/LPS O-acetylase OafA/YrhL
VVPAVPEGYRPHLDGLRTIAVYLVVLFHAGAQQFGNGFIGVDVFFVLSGYLVTQVLMRDFAAEGRVRFGRFYARRFRRLLPASALTLLVTAVVFAWVVSPVELANAVGSFQASYLYVANWYFIREATDYFAAGHADSPVLHFWSLAVEEQFYLLWPLLLAGLLAVASRAGARAWRIVQVAVAASAVASFGWAFLLSGTNPDRAYYGTDARAYQLLAGAFVAMTPAFTARLRRYDRFAPLASVASIVGLFVLSTDLVAGRPVVRGALTCVLTVALIVGLERRGGAAGRLLGARPMVDLGRISYGTYLWHWPVIVILARVADFDAWRTAIVTVGLSSGLAALSASLLEAPIRRSPRLDRIPRAVVACGLATSLVLGLVVIRPVAENARDIGSGEVEAALPQTSGGSGDVILTPIPDDFDEAAIDGERYSEQVLCNPVTGEFCTVVEGDGVHVLLLGDSNATMLIGPLSSVARSEGLTFTTAARNGCVWQDGYQYRNHPDVHEPCEQLHDRIYGSYLEEVRPDVVIAFNVLQSTTRPGPFPGGADAELYRSTIRESVDRILATGAKLVVVEPMPRGPRNPNPLNCLGASRYQEECHFLTPTDPYWIEEELRELDARYDQMWAVDLDRAVCPAKPVCEPYIDGIVVRWDDAHLTRRFAATLDDEMLAVLRAIGVVGG